MAVDVFEREGAWLEEALLRLLLERAELALDACERWDLVGDTDRFASLPFVRTFRRKASSSLSVCALASSLESLASSRLRARLRSKAAFFFSVWYDASAMDL
jgi:hypothetical protein